MSYAEHIKATLRPLHIYELDVGLGCNELEAEGAALDEIFDSLISCESDMLPQTASETGLARLEELLPFKPAAGSLTERRSAVAALLTPNGGCSIKALNQSLAGCGAAATVEEGEEPEQVIVSIAAETGLEELKSRIEQIIPCHLEIVYE